MKKMIFSLMLGAGVVVGLTSMTQKSAQESFWYVNGEEYHWHEQPDVFAFRLTGGSIWQDAMDVHCVGKLLHRAQHRDKMNLIFFKRECTENERQTVKNVIEQHPMFEAEFPVITLFPHLSYKEAKWFALDNLLLVNFNHDSLSESKFNAFKQEFGLQQLNFPDAIFPDGYFTYIFEYNVQHQSPKTAIKLAREIYELHNGFVVNIQPNLINAYQEVSDDAQVVSDNQIKTTPPAKIEYIMIHKQNGTIKLMVDLKNNAPEANIKVYDLYGRMLYGFNAMSSKIEHDINISGFVCGIYFVSIENRKGEVMGMHRFVKI